MKIIKAQEPKKPGKLKIYGGAALFTIIVGFSFLGVKAAMVYATPLEILAYRFCFAALGGVISMMLGLVKIRLEGKKLRRLIMPAGFYLAFMIFQALGLMFASSIESGILFAVIPIFAKIIAYFFLGERGNWKQNCCVTLSITAVVTMFVLSVNDFEGVNMWGLLLLTIASVLMAFSNVFTRSVRKEFSPFTIAATIAIGGALIFSAASLVHGFSSGGLLDTLALASNWRFMIATAFLGIPSTLVSSLLMAFMLANMEAVKATIFGNMSTAISIVAGVVFLHEPLFAYHIICTGLIIIGVIGTSLSGNGKEDKK